MAALDVTTQIEIERPVEEVFKYVIDENNIPKWDTDLKKAIKTSDGPTALGSTFHLDIKPFMGVTEGTGKIVGFKPNRLMQMQFSMGKMNPRVTHQFESAGEGKTTFKRKVEMQPIGFMALMAPMIKSRLHKLNAQYLETLKNLLEDKGAAV